MSVLRRPWALLLLLIATTSLHAGTVKKPVTESLTPSTQGIVLQNRLCRYEIGRNGRNLYFGTRDGKHNTCEPDQPFMVVSLAGQTYPSTAVALRGQVATVSFGETGVTARAKLEAKPDYLALTVEQVSGEGIEWLQVCNLSLRITESVGPLVNAAWDARFAACVLACNPPTESYGADNSRAVLCARAWPEYGLQGTRVAIIGLPTGTPEPGQQLLEVIGRVEVAEGLPHPMVNGKWLKQSPERFRSYLMCHDLGEANVDEVLRLAKGGFGCIEFYPWRSTPGYEINPGLFPNGLDGLKAVCEKIHAAGMQVGLHVMQGMVGWGPKDDPYIVPKADPRLLQDRHGTLSEAADEKATTLVMKGGTTDWPERGDLYLEGEVIQYTQRTDTGFTGVQRGLHGTTVTAHLAGATVGLLVNCFPIWGFTIYAPDLKTDLPDEICQRLADVFNAVGADMAYFDGGEELLVQKPYWRNVGAFALGVQKRLRKPVVLEGNALYTHHSWHVITRGSPHFDPIHSGRREYTLRFKGTNPANHARNLLVGDVGWFAPHGHSLTAEAVTPDEVLLLCLKAVGGRSPISFSVASSQLAKNPRMPEMLEIIRACDELKRREYFTPQALQALAKPRAEFHLEQTPDSEWLLRPMQFGPPRVVNAAVAGRASWECANPYAGQTPFVRVRARARLAAYGDPANIVLADPAKGTPFKAEATAADSLTQSIGPSMETTPEGSAALVYRAENRGSTVSQWTKASSVLPGPVDLSKHRRLGVWVKANGTGGILNIQLTGTDMRRDHYIPLDFTGWRLVELETPEDARVWEYQWPYSWTDLFYTDWNVYNATRQVDLYLNGVPAGATAECLIGRIEGLAELPGALRSPTLEVAGSRLTFPTALQPDEYVELDFAGRCRRFDANGNVLETVTPTGDLRLRPGPNTVRLSCDATGEAATRAEVTVALRGAPVPKAKRAGVIGKSAVYPTLAARADGGPR